MTSPDGYHICIPDKLLVLPVAPWQLSVLVKIIDHCDQTYEFLFCTTFAHYNCVECWVIPIIEISFSISDVHGSLFLAINLCEITCRIE